MYTVFNTAPRVGSVNIATVGLDYVKNVVSEQVSRYKEYRLQTPGYIESNHLLLKILNSLMVDFDGDLMSYQNRVAAQVNRLSGSMGLSNSAHHGRVFDKGTFYGDDVSEIYITTADTTNPRDLWNNWENMSCVRVLAHPCHGATVIELDGSLKIPNEFRMKINLAVLEINIPLMACQFQMWKLGNRIRTSQADRIPDSYFISQVILPNMLMSHLDICMLNELAYMFDINGTFDPKTNMPFYQTDVTGRLEDGVDDILKRFTTQTTTFPDMLRNVPCFGAKTLLEAVRMPDIAFTNQVIWALTAARLPLVAFLLKLNKANNNAKNDLYVNRFRRSIIEAQSGKYLSNGVPPDVADYFKEYLASHIEPYLKEI